ncbi:MULTISPECIES: hypothetical protein [unclassified Schlesneria]|uniref:hypothetical protein n=1 Tax=unclassified Schlesneria TaxID=2762017 RepID=UPI002F18C1F1
MTAALYKRNFSHDPWIDGFDAVQADGERGLNKVVFSFQDELDSVSSAFATLQGIVVPVSPTTTLTFAPTLFPVLTTPAWSSGYGIATKGSGQTSADGWMPIQLPDGGKIQSVAVNGEGSGSLGSVSVQLLRQSFSTSEQSTLVALQLSNGGTGAQIFASVGFVPDDKSLIDNGNFKYLIAAKIIGADATATAKLSGIQVVCKRV